jgi:hypothetical protein
VLSDYEREQFADIEARLGGDRSLRGSRTGRVRDDPRVRDRRRAIGLAGFALVLLLAGHALSLTSLSLLGALSLYLVTPCWYWRDVRASWVPQRPDVR